MVGSRVRLAIVTVLLCAVVSAAAVLALAQPSDPESSKAPPSRALTAQEISALPQGTLVSQMLLPADVDGMTILPSGSVPPPKRDTPPPKSGLTFGAIESRHAAAVGECQSYGLYLNPPYIPPGWQFDGCSADSIVWSDGENTDISYTSSYSREGYYPIAINRGLLAPGEKWTIINDDAPFALSVVDLGGGLGVVRHQAPGAQVNGPFSVTFTNGSVVTEIESAGIDVNELIDMAKSAVAADGR